MGYAYEDPKKRDGEKASGAIVVVGALIGVALAFVWFEGNPGILGGAVGGLVGMGIVGGTYRAIKAIGRIRSKKRG